MAQLSHTSDGVVKVTLAIVRCHCQVMLVTVLPSHASDGATEVTLAVVRCH
jgi:hypothetical protein